MTNKSENPREKLYRKMLHSHWVKIVSALASVVVFCTVYALILPAITMSNQDPKCGIEEHTHIAECYDAEGNIICGLEEHAHSLSCYSDLYAAIEDEGYWSADIPELTGDRNADVLAVAQSQIGYRENDENYLISENEQTKGYTRYGHWYGEFVDTESERLENGLSYYAYKDWDAMFASFVLYNANIYDMGLDSDAGNWAGALVNAGIYVDAADYVPQIGDLIFYTRNAGENMHVGIVSGVNRGFFGNEIKSISVIAGDSNNEVEEIKVAVAEYTEGDITFETIHGYGVLTPGYGVTDESTASEVQPDDSTVAEVAAEEIAGEDVAVEPAVEEAADASEAEEVVNLDKSADHLIGQNEESLDTVEENTEGSALVEIVDGAVSEDGSEIVMNWSLSANLPDATLPAGAIIRVDTASAKVHSMTVDQARAWAETAGTGAEYATFVDNDNYEVTFIGGNGLLYSWADVQNMDAAAATSFTGIHVKALNDVALGEDGTISFNFATTAKVADANVGQNYYVSKVSVNGCTGAATYTYENGEAETVDQNAVLRDAGLDEEPAQKTLVSKKSDYTVTMSYGPEAEIPDGSKLYVKEIRKGTKEYDQYIEDAKAALGISEEDAQELLGRFFDIKIMTKDGEFEPKAPVNVNIEYKKPFEAEDASAVSAVHFSEDGTETIPVETVDVSESEEDMAMVKSVEFSAESFSVYGVVYTVDFETVDEDGNVIRWSWPGRCSFAVTDIMAEIGIDGEVGKVNLERIEDKGGDQLVLYLEEKEDGWYLTSDEAFEDIFLLSVTVDGKEYEIRITDSTTNLNNLISDVSITENNGTAVQDGDTVLVGRDYNIHLSFAEGSTEAQQFADSDTLIYQLPAGVEVNSTNGTFDITYSGRAYGGNTYEYDPATRQLRVRFSPTVASLVRRADNASFTIDIIGSFNGQTTTFNWGNGQTKTYELDNHHETNITKTGYYDSNDNKIHYTLTATSTGVCNNVIINDNISGTALTLDQDSITYSGNSTAPRDINKSDKGFNMTFPSMADNETITIYYTASVDMRNITGKGTVEETGNSVTIKSDEEPTPDPVTHNFNNQIDYNPLKKNAGEATGDGMIKTVPWTITVNEQQLKSMAGTTITDTIGQNSRDIMSYSGDGITIYVMDGNSVIRTINRTWQDLQVDTSSDKTWHYTLPDDQDDRTHTYKYVISYTTNVDTTGKVVDFTVDNTVHDDEHHSNNGQGTVSPGGETVTLTKTNTGTTAGISSWTVTFTVPKAGLTKAVVTENLPRRWSNSGELLIDELSGNISVDGTIGTESYDIDTSAMSTEGTVIVTFYKEGEKTAENEGMLPSDAERTITLTFNTANNPDWLNDYPDEDHTNNVELNANGSVIKASDKSKPKNEGVSKTGFYAGTIAKDGKQYPIFKYTLSIYGVNEQSFLDNNNNPKNIVVTDTFDNNWLELYTGYTDDRGWYRKNEQKYLDTTVVPSGNTITITSDSDDFVTNTVSIGGENVKVYANVYYLDYYLIVKENKLADIEAQSLTNPVILDNHVRWDTFYNDVTIEYKYPVVDKETLSVDKNTGIAKFKIVLNPDKLTLNNYHSMTMTDSATNLSVDYSTLKIETDPQVAEGITYYYRGNTGYFTIPDNTKVTITYDARIIGDGTVTFSNEAKMNGYTDSTKTTEDINSSGSGNLDINWMLVYKHKYQQMDKPLNGAVYVITDSDGNPLLYPSGEKAGQPITFETRRLDLHALPDGLYVMNDGTYKSAEDFAAAGSNLEQEIANGNYIPDEKDGYTWLYLDMSTDGMVFNKGVTYYFKEYQAPADYQKSDAIYSFTIAEHPDYSEYEYYKGDILRFADTPTKGILNIEKNFVGAENLTENQKEQITFLITGEDPDGEPISIPYGGDGNNPEYAPISGLEISYADFENGKYSLDGLPVGTYTVKETAWTLSGYTYQTTTYKVDGVDGTGTEKTGEVTITSENKEHTVSYINTYGTTGASLNLIKKSSTNENIFLYGAKFQLSKFDTTLNDYVVVNGTNGADENGELTIGFENRETGINITDLQDGTYRLIETKAPNNYYIDNTPTVFTVNGGNVNPVSHSSEHVTFENSSYKIKNDLQHVYTLSKVDEFHLTEKLNGAVFTIYPLMSVSKNPTTQEVSYTFGTPITTKSSDENGRVEIDMKALGLSSDVVYSIKETDPPAGYALSEKVYSFYYRSSPTAASPAIVGTLNTYGESVVDLTNGPQAGYVPNTEDSMELYVRKQWYKVDGTVQGDRDITDTIHEIEVKLHQVAKDTLGTEISDSCYPDDETTYTLTIGGAGNQSFIEYRFTDLPTGDSVNSANPITYSYYVEEIVPEGYEARYKLDVTRSGNFKTDEDVLDNANEAQVSVESEKKEIQILNSPKPKHLKVTKVWYTDEPLPGDNPIVELWYRDATGEHPVTQDADTGNQKINPSLPNDSTSTPKDYTFEWTSLNPISSDGSEREYFVVENSGRIQQYKNLGYIDPVYTVDDDGNTVITNIKERSDKLKVKKIWLDSDGTELKTIPNTPVTVQLQKQEGTAGEGYPVTVILLSPYENSGGSGVNTAETKEFSVAKGTPLQFTIASGGKIYSEDGVTELAQYSHTVSIDSVDAPMTLTYRAETSEWGTWIRISDSSYNSPQNTYTGPITDVTTEDGILLNGSPITADQIRVTLDSSTDWMHTWDNLTTSNGKLYGYSVREVDVPAGFDVSYENDDGITTGVMYVKNTKSQYTRAVARKKWLNASGVEMSNPPADASVTFAIYQDGRIMSKTVTLDGTVDAGAGETGETEPWVATWEGLEYYKSDGETAHVYTIQEANGMTGYTAMVYDPINQTYRAMTSDDAIETEGTIYNKKVRSIEVVKLWRDRQGQEYTTLPDGLSVTINLYKNGNTVPDKSVTLDGRTDVNGEQTPWKATFDNLEDSATYTIDESGLPSNYRLIDPAGPGPITAQPGDSTITLINREQEPKYGSLNVKKELTPASAASNAANKTFTFEVTFTNPNGSAYTGNVTVHDSTRTTPTEVAPDQTGKITVTVIGDGTAKITKIPEGTKYVVTESAISPSEGWTQEGIVYSDTEKTITEGPPHTTDIVTVTNKYDATGSVDFKVTKNFTNGNLADKEFGFKLTQVTDISGTTPAVEGHEGSIIPALVLASPKHVYTRGATGTSATVSFNSGITFNYSKVGTYYFLIEEDIPDAAKTSPYVADGVQYPAPENAKKVITVVVEDNGDGTLVVKKDGVVYNPNDSSADADATFTNAKTKEFEFSKEWHTLDDQVSQEWPQGVEITVKVGRKIGESVDNSYELTYTIGQEDLVPNQTISPAGGQGPNLVVTSATVPFNFKLSNLEFSGSISGNAGEYTYFVTETQVDGYKPPVYKNGASESLDDPAINNGVIINKPYDAVELPSTGGSGITMYRIAGWITIVMALIGIYLNKRRERWYNG